MYLFLAVLSGVSARLRAFRPASFRVKGAIHEKQEAAISALQRCENAGIGLGIATLGRRHLKGYTPVAVAVHYNQPPAVTTLIGLSFLSGHLFPIYLKFKGGKGVATALGVFLPSSPFATLIAAGVFILVTIVWRYVSLGSLFCIGVMPLLFRFFSAPSPYIYLAVVTVFLVFFKHWGNLERLRTGTESKFSFRSHKDSK